MGFLLQLAVCHGSAGHHVVMATVRPVGEEVACDFAASTTSFRAAMQHEMRKLGVVFFTTSARSRCTNAVGVDG